MLDAHKAEVGPLENKQTNFRCYIDTVMSALGGGTSLTVAMAFLCIFFGSISLLFFILRLRQKKAEFKDETEKFYPNFLHLFVAIFLCLCYILYDC